jgi:hypothetical protein
MRAMSFTEKGKGKREKNETNLNDELMSPRPRSTLKSLVMSTKG